MGSTDAHSSAATVVNQPVALSVFMNTIFQDCVGVPVVAAPDFRGFMSQRWRAGSERGEQLYFCISTVRDIPRTSLLKRQADDLVKTYALVLDDIPSKVPVPGVPPTWVIESSPGNFQYGYRLFPAADPPAAAALVEALISGGHTDPGASGAQRVMRVPGSLNAKPTANGWRARVTVWNPDQTYTLEKLAELFHVKQFAAAPAAKHAPATGDEPDPVFDWLLGHGHVKEGPNPRGWYSITCPWEHTHQTQPYDHGTDYLPGAPGAFKCLHASCVTQSSGSLKSWIETQDSDADVGVISRELVASVGVALREAMKTSGSLREQLGLRVRAVPLGPWVLPDASKTAAGLIAMKQSATELRVEHVMSLIGAGARHNAMNGSVEITLKGYCSADDPSDAGLATIVHACDQCGMSNAQAIRQAVLNLALTSKFNPAEDWVTSLLWDGTDRLPELANTLELRDKELDPWKLVALRRWGLQVAAAIANYKYEEKAHPLGYVLVLQGEQGLDKSFWIKSLMPAGMVTLGLSLKLDRNEKDSVSRATSTPIGELAELDVSFKHSDISALKNFLTTPVDAYRPAYGYRTIRTPRSTAFAGTINPTTFLHDVTGARRFWPLGIRQCHSKHSVNMQQFWAQMWHLRVLRGEQYWLTPEEEELQATAVSPHEIENEISDIIDDLVHRKVQGRPGDKWVVANMKELLARYNVRYLKVNSADLTAGLVRAGFERGVYGGKRGFRVPNYTMPMTEAQIAGFKVVTNG